MSSCKELVASVPSLTSSQLKTPHERVLCCRRLHVFSAVLGSIISDTYSLHGLLHQLYKLKNRNVVVRIITVFCFIYMYLKSCFPGAFFHCLFLGLIDSTLVLPKRTASISLPHTFGDTTVIESSFSIILYLSKDISDEAPVIMNIHVLNDPLIKWL